jgi:exodeoxyribonuclease VII large subunit
MKDIIPLSALTGQIFEAIQTSFEGELCWVAARIMNVKKYAVNRRCYLTLEESDNGVKKAEIKAVLWATYYSEMENFEKLTGQVFKDGLEIICRVRVRFHAIYGLNLDIVQIDAAHTLGTLELERQQTLERLLQVHPSTIQLFDGVYRTYNNRLPLPDVIEHIALVTAPDSDGQRDFVKEITGNRHQYSFRITPFLTTIQGDNAHLLILEQLRLIKESKLNVDVVAIVRGGGAQADFKPFDQFELAALVANFPVPVFTGIGHDRNQSITDLMAREQKTPTKVAALFVDHNFEFENRLMALCNKLSMAVSNRLQQHREKLAAARRIIKLSSPQAILDRGFAIITLDGKIVTDPSKIEPGAALNTILKNTRIHSTVTKIKKDEKGIEL